MKIRYKVASTMALFGFAIIFLMSSGYYLLGYNAILQSEIRNLKNISEEVSLHLNSHLEGKVVTATTLSSALTIKVALLKSNYEFASLDKDVRKGKIDALNQQWMQSTDIHSPFVSAYMANPVAEYLKQQHTLIAGEYGEIFLTNRYGAMIATTGKLTTLAHAHKYWWKSAFDDDKGRIFLDDRGFDTSVKGYVLGVVVPIMDQNKVIGILKCNIKIGGVLRELIQNFNSRQFGKLKIVRTGGLIVIEQGAAPLSTVASSNLIELLQQKSIDATIISKNNEYHLAAVAPIPITMGSSLFGFGGSKESIDHIKGNTGEGWHAVIFLNKENALVRAHQTLLFIIIIGFIGTLLTTVVAFFLGKKKVQSITKLAVTAQAIGEGSLSSRTEVLSNDEIGLLAKSINTMAQNIQETIASRDTLLLELKGANKLRQKAEEEIKTLSGLIPICMHCKGIRDDKGSWNQLEHYISEHSEATFSHGCCPKCLTKYYPEIAELNKK